MYVNTKKRTFNDKTKKLDFKTRICMRGILLRSPGTFGGRKKCLVNRPQQKFLCYKVVTFKNKLSKLKIINTENTTLW